MQFSDSYNTTATGTTTPVAVSLLITTSDTANANGSYTATDISGTWNGQSVTGLSTYAGADNSFFPANNSPDAGTGAGYETTQGLAFSVATNTPGAIAGDDGAGNVNISTIPAGFIGNALPGDYEYNAISNTVEPVNSEVSMPGLSVGPDSTYHTIAEAMAVAASGDTIKLESGYSNDTATVTKSGITIDGDATSTGIVLQLAPGVGAVAVTGLVPIDILDSSTNNTITGNGGDNTITVTNGIDVVQGAGGIDRLVIDYSGATGAITGDSTSNFTEAGAGGRAVTIVGGFENFTVLTGPGADTITVGDGDNVINAGSGANTITAGNGNDTITGGDNADTITAGDGNNTIFAGAGTRACRQLSHIAAAAR